MKKILLLGVIGLLAFAVYYFFLQGPLKTDFSFNGEDYQHVEKRNAGDIINHNYTPNGVPAATSHHAIQILEFSENIEKKDWDTHLKGILVHYNLKPVKNSDFGWAGKKKQGKSFIKTYAAPIRVEDEDHVILYISLDDNPKEETIEEKTSFINKLKAIETTFQ